MSTSSSAPSRAEVLRGAEASRVSLARIDADLRLSPYASDDFADPRLVDPALAAAFDEAVAVATARGREEGYARGYAEGLKSAERERRVALEQEIALMRDAEAARNLQLQHAVAVLSEAATAAGERQVAALAGVEDLLLNAAFDLATTLLGRELEAIDAPVRDAVRRALAVLPGDVPISLYLHPIDRDSLSDVDSLLAGRPVRIFADSEVEPGSCVAEAGTRHVDASLSAAIDRVRQVLSP